MAQHIAMSAFWIQRDLEWWAYSCLVAAAFGCGFSPVVAGRTCLAVSLVLLVVHLVRQRQPIKMSGTGWLWLVFVACAVFSTSIGVAPARGFANLSKIFWFVGIPLCATLVTSTGRLSNLLRAYALGAGMEAVKILVWNPVLAWRAVAAGKFKEFMPALVDRGSMDFGQIMMLGMVISLGFIFMCRREQRATLLWWGLLLLQTVALVMMFKRGSWVCACLVIGLFVAFKTNWKYLLAMFLCIMATLALPPVRARMADLKHEFHADSGGRMRMWLNIAPPLIKAHPWGIGYQVLTNEMMKDLDRKVEPNRNHLHSNILQVLVDTGWLGLCVYLIWMGAAFLGSALLAWRSAGGEAGQEMTASVLFLLLTGLLLNGLVEYNFGRAPMVPAYGLVLGCIAAAGRLKEERIQKSEYRMKNREEVDPQIAQMT